MNTNQLIAATETPLARLRVGSPHARPRHQLPDRDERIMTSTADTLRIEIDRLGDALRVARAAERDAMRNLASVVVAAHAEGVSESEIARRSGVTRMTVRSMLGK